MKESRVERRASRLRRHLSLVKAPTVATLEQMPRIFLDMGSCDLNSSWCHEWTSGVHSSSRTSIIYYVCMYVPIYYLLQISSCIYLSRLQPMTLDFNCMFLGPVRFKSLKKKKDCYFCMDYFIHLASFNVTKTNKHPSFQPTKSQETTNKIPRELCQGFFSASFLMN